MVKKNQFKTPSTRLTGCDPSIPASRDSGQAKLNASGRGFAFGYAEAGQFLILGLEVAPGIRPFVVNVVFAVNFRNSGCEDVCICVVGSVHV